MIDEDQWISVKDKLPNMSQNVLVWGYPWEEPQIAYFGTMKNCYKDGIYESSVVTWRFSHSDEIIEFFSGFNITHWLPLPKPPQK